MKRQNTLHFSPKCKLTTQELRTMISAVLDEQSEVIAESREQLKYGWGLKFSLFGANRVYEIELEAMKTGEKVLSFVLMPSSGINDKAVIVYDAALSWGAYEVHKRNRKEERRRKHNRIINERGSTP